MTRKLRSLILAFSILAGTLNTSAVLAEEEPPLPETEEIADDNAPSAEEETPAEQNDDSETGIPGEEEPSEVITDPETTPEPAAEQPEITEETPEETADPAAEEIAEEEPAEEETSEEEPEAEEETAEEAELFSAPEGFVFEESDAEEREALTNEDILNTFDSMEEGVDYVSNELIFLADSEEYAVQVADIYHGELTSLEDGVAVVTITDPEITVKDAFSAAVNGDETLPLVGPNYIVNLEPHLYEPEPEEDSEDAELYGYKLPEPDTWDDFIHSNFSNPDPYLKTPTSHDFQWHHDMINTYAGWNATTGNRNIKVAVIDTMLNVNHEEFTGSSGRVTKKDIVGNGSNSYYTSGHGNHVAGIIGANVNNGKGGSGIAPGVSIIGMNVFQTNERCYNSDVIAAINRSVSLGANIINMSLGSHAYDSTENQAMQRAYKAGVVLVAAAGNENTNVKSYPAAYKHVISVAAINRTGRKAHYSNYGSWVTIAAPGSGIWSSVTSSSNTGNAHYEEMSGTSMACPVVTGVIALYMSKNGPMTYDQIVPILKKSTTKSPSSGMGAGIINVGKLFSRKEQAPVFKVYNSYGSEITGNALSKAVPAGSYVRIYDELAGNNDTLIYTTDGRTPSIKNGEVINGTVISSGGRIYLSNFAKESTVTFKAAVVNSLGVLGTVKTFKVKAPAVTPAAVKIKTLKLSETKKNMDYSSQRRAPYFYLSAASLINTKGESRTLSQLGTNSYKWVSSNEKVATVNQSGRVTAVGPGTAKITLKILDGSKKSATCTVTVKQLAESITIKGQDGIAQGASANYTASFAPTSVSSKKVTWTLSSSYADITMKNGKVTVGKSVPVGASFTIRAAATDGSNITVSKTIRVVNKATGVKLSSSGKRNEYDAKSGNLKNVILFTYNLASGDNTARLYKTTTGNTSAPVLWTSSNPKVATVSTNGTITAVSDGKTTVTCTANDGSKKKASVTVIVRNPASSLTFDLGFNETLMIGKSMELADKVAYGSTYGTPSLKKSIWSIQAVYNDNGSNVTSSVLNNKYVTISSDGKLTTSSNLKSMGFSNGNAYVRVKATAADGSGHTATCDIKLHPSNTIKFAKSSYNYRKYKSNPGEGVLWLLSEYPVNFTVKSSNGNKIGTYVYNFPERRSFTVKRNGRYVSVYGYAYPVIAEFYANKGGTVTITAKAQDGSGKTAKTKVTIKNY